MSRDDQYNSSCICQKTNARPWRNWQTRTFEGRVGNPRTSSSLVPGTIIFKKRVIPLMLLNYLESGYQVNSVSRDAEADI